MHTLFPAPILPLDGGALRVSICGLLVPREREGMELSTHPSPTCNAEAQILRRRPSVRPPSILARRSGLAFDPGPPPLPAMQEAEYLLHRSLSDTEAGQ